MDENPSPATDQSLTDQERSRGQSLLIGASSSARFAGHLLGSTASLFLLALGATPFHLGVLETLSNGSRLMRVVGVQALRETTKAQLIFRMRLLSAPAIIGLVLLAHFGQVDPRYMWIAILTIASRFAMIQIGMAAWWPIVQDNTTRASLPMFLARLRMAGRGVELVLPLFVGWYLGSQPAVERFGWLYVAAFLVTMASAWLVRRVRELPSERPTEGLGHRFFAALKIRDLQRYCLFNGTMNLIHAASLPFWVVVFTQRGMPILYFVWMISIRSLGHLATLYSWGRLIQSHGSRPAISLALGGMFVLAPFWQLLPTGSTNLVFAAGLFYFLWGAFEAGLQSGQTPVMMESVATEYRAEGFTVSMYSIALGGGIGGIVGGLIFERLNEIPADAPSWEPELLYLSAAHLLSVPLWLLSRNLKGAREQLSAREFVRRRLLKRRRQT